MKILLLGAFGPGALENYYLRGLRQGGICCETYDITEVYYQKISKSLFHKSLNKIYPGYFFNDINKGLFEWVKGKAYDVILVFKGLTLYSETIQNLKQFAELICCYNPDHPFIYYQPGSGNANISNSIRHYDLYVSFSEKIAAAIQEKFNVHSSVIPFGYDEEAVPGTSKELIDGKFAFIGSYDKERSNMVNKLNTKQLVVYGDAKWYSRTTKSSKSRQFYKGKSLYGQEYIDAVAQAAGVFNFLRWQNIQEGSHNMRTFEVPGYGGLLISERTAEQEYYFKDNAEAVYFDSLEELNDKLSFLGKNPSLINNIKKNARLKCIRGGHGYNQRARQLIEILKIMMGTKIAK